MSDGVPGRRGGRTLAGVMWTKAMQEQGKRVLWATANQAGTAEMLARHGALSLVVGEHYLCPKFRSDK